MIRVKLNPNLCCEESNAYNLGFWGIWSPNSLSICHKWTLWQNPILIDAVYHFPKLQPVNESESEWKKLNYAKIIQDVNYGVLVENHCNPSLFGLCLLPPLASLCNLCPSLSNSIWSRCRICVTPLMPKNSVGLCPNKPVAMTKW